MGDIQRWDHWVSESVNLMESAMVTQPDGDYVLYSDHCSEVERLKARPLGDAEIGVEILKQEVERLKEEKKNAEWGKALILQPYEQRISAIEAENARLREENKRTASDFLCYSEAKEYELAKLREAVRWASHAGTMKMTSSWAGAYEEFRNELLRRAGMTEEEGR